MPTARSLGQALVRASPRTASRAVFPVSQHAMHRSSTSGTQGRVAHAPERRASFSRLSWLRRQSEQDSDSDVHPAKIATHHSGYGNSDDAPIGDNHPDAVAEEKARDSSGGGEKKSTQKDGTTPQSNGGGSVQDTPLHVAPDTMADGDARGRTGGGEPLSSSRNAPPQPKILNASVPGGGDAKLTKEQQEEVDKHNKEFEDTFDHAENAPEDKVNKKFWSQDRASD